MNSLAVQIWKCYDYTIVLLIYLVSLHRTVFTIEVTYVIVCYELNTGVSCLLPSVSCRSSNNYPHLFTIHPFVLRVRAFRTIQQAHVMRRRFNSFLYTAIAQLQADRVIHSKDCWFPLKKFFETTTFMAPVFSLVLLYSPRIGQYHSWAASKSNCLKFLHTIHIYFIVIHVKPGRTNKSVHYSITNDGWTLFCLFSVSAQLLAFTWKHVYWN